MVQERNRQPRKVQDSDLDRQPSSQPIPPKRYQDAGSPMTDIASGLALLLSIISFFLSCYAAIQAGRRNIPPAQASPQSFVAPSQAVSRPVFPQFSKIQQVEPGQFIQPTQDRSAQVELLSARRTLSNNLTTIQLRVHRLNRPVTGLNVIDLANTIALNSRTNARYPIAQSQTPNDQFIMLSSLRPGSSLMASITVRVPEDLDRIDLDVPNVQVFRNVPISIG
ncbi:MAG: hypothetical protein MUC48_16380 [Leptolyngbya sp. Prado105]|nr:hypothetical protein [Leptolyngbya sp. Prado105]